MLLGKLRPNQPIHIVGAGISGLLLGHYLKKRNIHFTIHEKTPRTGGLLETKKTSYGLVETAANGIISSDDVMELISDLKLEVIKPRSNLKRFIHREKVLKTFPFRASEIFSIIPKLMTKTSVKNNQTLNEFLSPLFGPVFCQEVVSTGVRGIYAIDGDELDYEAILPKANGESFFQYLKKIIQEKKGKEIQTISFQNGMQDLVNHLTTELKSNTQLNSNYSFSDKDNVIFCTDAHSAAKIIESIHPEIAHLLKKVPYKSISTNTVFTSKQIEKLDHSFGLLSSTLNSYGILANDQIFENRTLAGLHSYTLIKPISGSNRQEIVSDLSQLGLVEADIKEIITTNWEQGIPRYNLERKKIMKDLADKLESINGLLFFGNYVSGLSLREILKTAKQFSLEQV